MDSARFDALTRTLSENTTRRGLTRLLGSLALGGLLHPNAIDAMKRGNRKKGDNDKKGGKAKANKAKTNEKKGKVGTERASATSPPKFNPPKQSYLALGDSLAFGFQFPIFNQYFPNVPPDLFAHGYVNEFSRRLQPIRPDIKTINYGCPEETTDSFIGGGCPYTTTRGFELHDSYSGSQLDAAITFLRAHHGQVSPITFNLGANDLNLGANDLNALQVLCENDVACYKNQGPIVLERIRENLDEILGALRAAAPDSEILTFTQYNIDPRFMPLSDAFNAVVVSTAATHRVRVADVFAAFKPAPICDLTLVCAAISDVHPSDAGYKLIAEQLWQASAYDKLDH